MKNPLIEAIRQADDDDNASQAPADQETAIDVSRDPANDEHVLETDGLALMETASALDVGAPPHGLEPQPGPESDSESHSESEPAFEDADAAEPESDEPAAERASNTEACDAGNPGRQDPRLRGLPAIGRIAPLLCLLFAGSAAAIYIAYQALGGGYGGVRSVRNVRAGPSRQTSCPILTMTTRGCHPALFRSSPQADKPVNLHRKRRRIPRHTKRSLASTARRPNRPRQNRL